MAQQALLQLIVTSPQKSYEFVAQLHRSEKPEDQRIDSAFYLEWAKKVHAGTHFEIQLLESPVFGRANPNVPIHVHKHPDKPEYFVCYTPQVETHRDARDLFRQWCVGTVYSIDHQKDFASIVGEHPKDFLEFMAAEYGIEIEE